MQTLDNIQHIFYQAIIKPQPFIHPDFIKSPFAAERLAVYRDTIFENMRNTLHLTFPGVWSLLGEKCADNIAYTFCFVEHHFPSTGCLDDFGETFPNFLGHVAILSTLPYLKEYALYEWLKHQANFANSAKAIIPADLQAIPEEQIEHITCLFIPSFYLFKSIFPIQAIQNIVDHPEAPPLELTEHPTYGIIARPNHDLLTIWIEADLWHFISFLQQGDSLAQSTTKTQINYPTFNLTNALHFLLQNQLICKIKK